MIHVLLFVKVTTIYKRSDRAVRLASSWKLFVHLFIYFFWTAICFTRYDPDPADTSGILAVYVTSEGKPREALVSCTENPPQRGSRGRGHGNPGSCSNRDLMPSFFGCCNFRPLLAVRALPQSGVSTWSWNTGKRDHGFITYCGNIFFIANKPWQTTTTTNNNADSLV